MIGMSTLPQPHPEPVPDPSGRRLAAPPVGSPLVVRTVACEDPGALLGLIPRGLAPDEILSWVRRGEGLVGWGRAETFTARGPQRFTEAQAWWGNAARHAVVRDEVGLPGTGPVVFGSVPFADDSAEEALFIVPEVVVGHRDGTWWLTTIGPSGAGLEPRPVIEPTRGVRFADASLTSTDWMGVVAEAVRRIEAGEVDKVVLARDVEAHVDAPIDLRWPLRRLASAYAGCWTFAVDGLVGATPELLVRLREGVATSRVLAGTLRRSGDANQDLRRSEDLSRSIKDLEEHGYGVRSVADALALHCRSVEVPTSPFVLELPNVMHLATDVTGTVTDGASVLELLASLHPSAAVCGTPTAVALDLIREIEGLERGRYAGPVGWMDANGDGEWGIALRCGQLDPTDPTRMRLYAGCGIVAGSEPTRELAESNAKLVPMRDALSD